MNEDFDFGFSSTSSEEIAEPLIKQALMVATHKTDRRQAKEMLAAIMPLLDNLAKDGETNPYIHWPNRVEKIEQFKKRLDFILNS